jgi:hypothetical protein
MRTCEQVNFKTHDENHTMHTLLSTIRTSLLCIVLISHPLKLNLITDVL